ncbi:ATP-grasp domain-containing protein [Oceanobacillus jeddahense]|uniref:ATP-grasp domain-containing protein n=1 Tax=Oceanobacillus jeddahense TaxID=1462527 RepID=A0ABY5JTP0_9BACI|nr:ATP-grasp domain-containing protein [Oceanobacillus jeddahense]UUI02543.1 ATP-grasp domain-containing protein [Oceanobacillus jeddahense]
MNIKEITGRSLSTSNRILAEEAYNRGVTFEALPNKQFKMSYDKKSYIIRGGKISSAYNTRLAGKLTKYKNATGNFLRGMGYSSLENAVFLTDEVNRAWKWAEDILPVVVKPNDGIMGKLVFVKIDTYDEFKACFEKIAEVRDEILIEKFIEGAEYRFTFVKNDIVAVVKRVPANIVGDGLKNIEQLITSKNKQRSQRKNPLHKKLDMGEESERVLKKQGLSFNVIPKKGETIYLRNNSNVSTGGDAIDVTDDIQPELKETIRKAILDIPGLRVCGVDVLINGDDYHILEINAHAMLTMHHFPWEGEKREVVSKVIDGMFPGTLSKG